MEYEVIIGIEIHCELKTKTKMFSGAPVLFGAPANTCVNEIDLGHPGTMPCLNKQAVAMAVQACTALNMEIDPLVRFDRKNYYYTDLPKGFQITQPVSYTHLLYRSNYLSRALEKAMIEQRIPYVIYGGIKFYERAEIKDALCYLRMVCGSDDLALMRIINVPRRGLGNKTMDTIVQRARETRCV